MNVYSTKIPAPIDEKNVSTDWIESVFDNEWLARDTRTMVGFIRHCVVKCYWDWNKITWEVSRDISDGDTIEVLMLLEERLKGFESDEQNIWSMIQRGDLSKLQLVQTFYFKED